MIALQKRIILLTFALATLLSTALDPQLKASTLSYSNPNGSLTSQESQVIELINGTGAYNYDLELEKIALNHSVSNYAFRAGGSAGATATAMWLKQQFENFGLETSLESFEFTNWNLLSKPSLIIDDYGNLSTTDDQTSMDSFQSEHYSWPTPEGGVSTDLVVLPLPEAADFSDIGSNSIDTAVWNSIDTSGRIVLIGREVRWDTVWEQTYRSKLMSQTPAAVIYTWWYNWTSFIPPFFSSVGGRPTSTWGPYYWDLTVPVGWVNSNEGLWIRLRESTLDVAASVTINSVIASGPHYNVVARLQGTDNPDKFVIISGHYDTVMTGGFADNGAGTAGVVELARVFSESAKMSLNNSDYSIVFVAFGSEELGLVGSTNYAMQHKAEMSSIVAVINLDCIGNDNLYVTQTDDTTSLNLDQRVLEAADDLNITVSLHEQGGSDQEVFRNPSWASGSYSYWWPNLTANIGDASPVLSSTMLISYPLLYSDIWNGGTAGWIHTSYDNSTSSQTLNWVKPSNLEDQLKVAALSVIRIVPSSQVIVEPPPFSWLTIGLVAGAIVAVVAVVTVLYFVKKRRPPATSVVR